MSFISRFDPESNDTKLFNIALNNHTYFILKSRAKYNNNINKMQVYTDLNSKERINLIRRLRHYILFNSDQFEALIKSQQTLEDICKFFNLEVYELDYFLRAIYKKKYCELANQASAEFKVNLFNYALQMSQKSPVILKLFMDKYLDFSKDKKDENIGLTVPEQLLNLLEDKR